MLRLELAEFDTLMKLTVVDSDGRLGLALVLRLALALHNDFVIDAELALGHSAEIGLHQDLTCHVGRKYLAQLALQ